ncbi:MAG: type II toxin-antitoxin system HicA family toxin [Thiohalocapsa sp.]|jgi:predicted RNA binding protein YcfA (HicA-like mRNA interferase family)|uniref:type II toxin-antitoxin system HicA family toxin n=1 Tax=Thiohalocapsa sp. TaxID=2497641 RepID=UPI0025D4990C|nr:type II toxin-antitoxin system HicA family toxin [Thiohalocapsa sp.]MCG6941350.1 type II toxin-antitoxin system HicA family toxin [Thiohalocapsa sp.]
MPKSLSRRELIRKFRALGWTGPHAGKRHQFMQRGTKKIRIPNPHGSGDIGAGLIAEILRQAGISQQDWDGA